MTRTLLVLLAATLAALAASPVGAEWTQFRGEPAQRGVADSVLPETLVPVWTFRVPEGAETTPAIAGGKVYLGGLGGTFHALDLASGKSLWTHSLPETPEIKSSALVWDGVVYFGDEYGGLHALDAETGAVRWTFEGEAAFTSSPTRLDAADGAGRCVIVGSYDNNVYCFDPATGDVRWKQETEGYVHGTPGIARGGRVVSSGCDGYVRVLTPGGAETVELQVGSYVAGSPAIDGDRIFVGNFDSEVLAVDLAKGEVTWRYSDPDRDFPFYSSPALSAGLVIIGGRDKRVHAIDAATGTARWTHSMRARVEASPVVSGDRVAVADLAGILRLLKVADGSVSWEFEAGDGFAGSPAVSDGTLVIASADGTVYAFSGRAAAAKPRPSEAP